MGYLDNSSVIVDAILTKKGRELLSQQNGSFNITQFALADDEIDYTLYNENHPNGSAFYGEAIEALPLIEAIPNENNTMVSKLATLNRGSTIIPTIQVQSTAISITRTGGGANNTFTITPSTNGLTDTVESGYSFTVADRRILFSGTGVGGPDPTTFEVPFTGTALSQTFVGTSFTGTALKGATLFGSNTALTTSIIVVGLDTGARTTITLTVTKESSGGTTAARNL
jgi:hypothetical protein